MRHFAAIVCLFASACTCDSVVSGLEFACSDDADCVEGFTCQRGACSDQPFDGGSEEDDAGQPASDGGDDAGQTTSDGGTDAGWAGLGWSHRRALVITAPVTVPANYAVRLELDHASLVTSGDALASGDDVRVVCNGAEQTRVADTGHGWNTATTRVWFRVPRALTDGEESRDCFLYFGAPDAGTPPATANDVFLLYDGFESGTLDGWNQEAPGLWTVDGAQRHGGARAMHYPPDISARRELSATPALDAADMLLEAWFFFADGTQDMALRTRVAPGNNAYEASHQGRQGWNLVRVIDGDWQQLMPPAGYALQDAGWTRVGLAVTGEVGRIFVGDELITPVDGGFPLGRVFTSGNVGFNKYRVVDGGGVWIDDVVARPFVFPEPTVTVEPE